MNFNYNILKGNLQKLMEKHGYNNVSLAKKINMTRLSILNILHGKNKNPSITTVSALAQALDCSIDELIGHNYTSLQVNPKLLETAFAALAIELKDQDMTIDEWCNALKELYINISSISSRKNNKVKVA